jgi:hypothetical protein
MLRKLRSRLTYANVVATLALFVALGGTAYAVNTVNSSDIVDGQVKSVDIGQNEIGSADVKDNSINTFDVHSFIGEDVVDGTLEDQDIAEGTFVNFDATIGGVAAHACVDRFIYGVNAKADHLVITPNFDTADSNLSYNVMYEGPASIFETADLRVCNPTDTAINDGNTRFNLLVIDAK